MFVRFPTNFFVGNEKEKFLGRLLVVSLCQAIAFSRYRRVSVAIYRGLSLRVTKVFCGAFGMRNVVPGDVNQFSLYRVGLGFGFVLVYDRARSLTAAT